MQQPNPRPTFAVMTAEQARTLGEWVKTNAEIGSAASVQLEIWPVHVYACQGDSYVTINAAGEIDYDA